MSRFRRQVFVSLWILSAFRSLATAEETDPVEGKCYLIAHHFHVATKSQVDHFTFIFRVEEFCEMIQ